MKLLARFTRHRPISYQSGHIGAKAADGLAQRPHMDVNLRLQMLGRAPLPMIQHPGTVSVVDRRDAPNSSLRPCGNAGKKSPSILKTPSVTISLRPLSPFSSSRRRNAAMSLWGYRAIRARERIRPSTIWHDSAGRKNDVTFPQQGR